MFEMFFSCLLFESMFEYREFIIVFIWCFLILFIRGLRLEELKVLGYEYMYMYIYYYNNFNGCFVNYRM